ncbi:hypothetical protein [Gorillibacterium timonense]|uniref:hypothetical protein n=1 Tax=Gorillibacterium timonense TaxID=1689269 RepID=UPI00071D6B1D|nr:hypothetical protein [Gorillibacterium timonense]
MKIHGQAKRILYGSLTAVLLLSMVSTANAVGKRSSVGATPETTVTVLISSLENKNGQLILTADPIEWYQGAEADKVFAERDPEGAAEIGRVPDGYYIVNDEKTLETFDVSAQAQVLMQLYDPYTIKWNEEITLNQFIEALDGKGTPDQKAFPYHLTLKDGKVVKIVQQYTP